MIRQGIITKETNSNKIKVMTAAGNMTTLKDDSLSTAENHKRAAEILCKKLGWTYTELLQGGNSSSDGYVFILV
jgi:hypothetical protein